MTFPKAATFGVALLLTASPILAQQVLVVDDDGGAGVHFTAIQPAIDAASPGDTVLVKAGVYSPTAPLTIRAESLSLTGDATATVQVVMSKGGTVLTLPVILQRVSVRGDRDVVRDPVLLEAEVTGLLPGRSWFFGMSIGIPDHDAVLPIARLLAGRGRMFVPRGVPLRARLHAMRFSPKGRSVPGGRPHELAGFPGEFTVPATGEPESLRFAAPSDLSQQLSKFDAAAPR